MSRAMVGKGRDVGSSKKQTQLRQAVDDLVNES